MIPVRLKSLLLSGVCVAALLLLPRFDAWAFISAPPGWQTPDRYASLADRPKYVFLIVIDGGVPSYFKLADFPHLAGLQRLGSTYSQAWDGMLQSETPVAHASLGTGSLPRRHGVLGFAWVRDNGTVEHPTNPIPIQQGDLERVLRGSGVPSIASELKRSDPSATTVVVSGHKDYAVDSVGGPYADYLMFYKVINQIWTPVAIPRHVPPQAVMDSPGLTTFAPHLYPGQQDSLAVQLALSAFRNLHQRLTIINAPEFDWPLGHLDGGPADTWFAWKLMTGLDSDVGAIESQLKSEHILQQTLFVVTSDHGMVALRHVINHALIENAVAKAGTSLIDYAFHTAGYLWLRDPSRSSAVARAVVALHNPYISAVYYRVPGTYSYEGARGIPIKPATDRAYQFLLSTQSTDGSPSVVIMMKEGTSIQGRNQTNWQGDHGGASWHSQNIPLVLSGPGVRRGYRSQYPATIWDVAPTILSLVGASYQGMDGVPLADSLTNASDSDLALQQRQGAELAPLVNALKRQSAEDLSVP